MASAASFSRALVFIAHGAGEHCGPYDELAQRLKELSLLAFAHDHGERRDTHAPPHCLHISRLVTGMSDSKNWPIVPVLPGVVASVGAFLLRPQVYLPLLRLQGVAQPTSKPEQKYADQLVGLFKSLKETIKVDQKQRNHSTDTPCHVLYPNNVIISGIKLIMGCVHLAEADVTFRDGLDI